MADRQMDSFARDNLPPVELWPDLLLDVAPISAIPSG